MKKIILSGIVLGIFLANGVQAFSIQDFNPTATLLVQEWAKDKDQAWAGKDMVWYKLDEKATVWWSKDGKKWEAVKDGMWQDKDGKWLKIGDKKLWWSADGGKTWSEVPEWKWMGTDGKWYKFDSTWALWINE